MPKQPKTVAELVTSVSALANHTGLSQNAIRRWIKVNRIPQGRLSDVEGLYGVPVPVQLTRSNIKSTSRVLHKPRTTLPLALKVQKGQISIEKASCSLGLHPQSLRVLIAYWGERLSLLNDTLCGIETHEISIQQAAETLNVTKFTIHALRKKYGFEVQPRPAKPERPIVARRKLAHTLALKVMAGEMKLKDTDGKGLSWRTVHREIKRIEQKQSEKG